MLDCAVWYFDVVFCVHVSIYKEFSLYTFFTWYYNGRVILANVFSVMWPCHFQRQKNAQKCVGFSCFLRTEIVYPNCCRFCVLVFFLFFLCLNFYKENEQKTHFSSDYSCFESLHQKKMHHLLHLQRDRNCSRTIHHQDVDCFQRTRQQSLRSLNVLSKDFLSS